MKNKSTISRRKFLVGAGAATAGMSLINPLGRSLLSRRPNNGVKGKVVRPLVVGSRLFGGVPRTMTFKKQAARDLAANRGKFVKVRRPENLV
jgi:hypothetical protein